MEVAAIRPAPVLSRAPSLRTAPVDGVAPGRGDEKARLLETMVRCTDESMRAQIVQCLGTYPLAAVQRVHASGTSLEIYGPGEPLPPGMEMLRSDDYLGGFNPQTNTIGMRAEVVNAFTLLHEFAHALDASLGMVSHGEAWQGAWGRAKGEGRCVRENATHNPTEYLADDVAAWLIPDGSLQPLIHMVGDRWPLAARDREHYSHGRLETLDPEGFHLAEDLLHQ